MNKKTVFGVIGVLAVVASIVMYRVGRHSSHLSELKNFWWYPLPLAVICFLAAASPVKKTK
jgi:CDP-diglyceride synthetase